MIKNLISILGLSFLLSIANAMSVTQGTHITINASSGGSVPTNMQIILQGEAAPNGAAYYNQSYGGAPSSTTGTQPNYDEIGWQAVSGASTYNLYDNGTEVVSGITDSQASTNYSTYVSLLNGNQCYNGYNITIPCTPAPGINRAYFYQGATNVMTTVSQSFARGFLTTGAGPVVNATGNINTGGSPGLHTLNVTALATNSIIVGQQINAAAGLIGNACVVSSTSGSLPALTVNFSTTCTNTSETSAVIWIAGNGSFTGVATWSSGASSMVVSILDQQTIYAGQGIGGPGLPTGTTVLTFGSTCDGTPSTGTGSTGTYCLSNASTATESGQTFGTVYLVNQQHLLQVTAVVGGVETTVGTSPGTTYATNYAILPFITAGELLLSAGVFSSPGTAFVSTEVITSITNAANAVITLYPGLGNPTNLALGYAVGQYVTIAGVGGMTQINGLSGQITALGTNTLTVNINSSSFSTYTSGGYATPTSPATTPLGYTTAALWNGASVGIINTFSGQDAAGYNLGAAGYPYIYLAVYTSDSGLDLNYEPEIAGDGELEAVTNFTTQGFTPQPLISGQWNVFKLPLCGTTGVFLDSTTGLLGKTNVCQTAFYKITWGLIGTPTHPLYVEMWFSRT